MGTVISFAEWLTAQEDSTAQPFSDTTRATSLRHGYPYISFGARGLALLYSNRPAEAVGDFSRAIALKNDIPGAYYSRAIAYEQMGQRHRADADYVKALSLLNEAIAATPKDGFLHQERGLVFERTGREDQAIADETRALVFDTVGPAYAHVYRGLAYDRNGLQGKAVADLQSAVRIDKFSKLEWDQLKRLDARFAARR